MLRAVVEHDGGDYDRVKKVTIGFSAVPSLIAGRVDAVVAFWNAEGVALRERGVETREFRVDDYGAPRYPGARAGREAEDASRARGELVDDMLGAIAEGTRRRRCATATDDGRQAGARVGRRRAADARPAARRSRPRSCRRSGSTRAALEGWARFDERFGILREAPDVEPGVLRLR